MHQTNITVKRIAQSSLNHEAAKQWITEILGFSEYEIPELDPENGVTPAALIIMMAAKRCYMAFDVGKNPNITRVRKDLASYLDNILKSGHGSVCEHVSFTYAIDGVTRVFTGEMNRHRAGVAISEGSMRYIRMDDIGFWMPEIFKEDNAVLRAVIPKEVVTDKALESNKLLSQQIFRKAFQADEQNIEFLNSIWNINDEKMDFKAKKILTSAFRRIIGMGVSTGGVWTVNVRALRHILALRGNKEHAEEEIYCVADMIADDMIKEEPLLFGDFEKDPDTGIWKPKYPKV